MQSAENIPITISLVPSLVIMLTIVILLFTTITYYIDYINVHNIHKNTKQILSAICTDFKNENNESYDKTIAKNKNLFINKNTEQFIIDLCKSGNTEDETLLKILLSFKIDINVLTNPQKKTYLMYACESDNLNIVKELLKNGANPRLRDSNNCDAFSYASGFMSRKKLIYDELILYDPKYQKYELDSNNYTLLMLKK